MSNWKFLIADRLEDNGRTILMETAPVDYRPDITPAELLHVIPAYHAMIVRSRTKVTAELLKNASQMKVIGRAGVGVDNIDIDAAKSHGIIVVNSPNAASLAVAELTLGLIFALARGIPKADHGLKAGNWEKKSLTGMELSGKTLGIIGLGKIGARVSERAAALIM